MLFIDVKKGFSLLELILVLGVGTMVAFMKFQDMKNEQEQILANAVGQQIKQVGEAVNGYINIRYDKIALLSNASGNGTDPGPRNCNTASPICFICCPAASAFKDSWELIISWNLINAIDVPIPKTKINSNKEKPFLFKKYITYPYKCPLYNDMLFKKVFKR